MAPSAKIALGAIWAALLAYALLLGPPADAVLEHSLWTGQFGKVDASIVALFVCLGVNAELYLVFFLRDGRLQRVPGWPFALASFGLGSFALIPYLLLRSSRPGPAKPAGRVTRILSSRVVGWILLVAIVALAAFGILRGHAAAFALAFRTSALVHVMTLDFILEAALLYLVLAERRRLDPPVFEPALARALRFIPLLGPALWNALVRQDA